MSERLAYLTSRRRPRPTFQFDAASGQLPAGSTFSRASTATRLDYRGYMVEAANDVARFTYDPALPYNQLINSWGDGIVVPSTGPTAWAFTGGGGLPGSAIQWLGTGVEDGIPYVDLRFVGTTSTGTGLQSVFAPFGPPAPGRVDAAPGAAFTGEIWLRLIGGAFPGGALTYVLAEYSDAAYLTEGVAGISTPTNAPLGSQRTTLTRTVVNAGTTNITPSIRIPCGSGVAVDFTLRIGFPTLTSGATPLSNIVPLSTLSARVGTTPQYGLLGLLLEEAATNLVLSSNNFTTADYTNTNVIVTNAAVVAPIGSASRIDEGTNTPPHTVQGAVAAQFSTSAGELITLSVYAKAETSPGIQLAGNFGGFGGNFWATFNLLTGTVGTVGTGAQNPSIIAVGNGWYRCSVVLPAIASTTALGFIAMVNDPATATRAEAYTGTNRTVLIANFQVERGQFPSSYVATPAGATATRARDAFSADVVSPSVANCSVSMRFSLARNGSSGEWPIAPRFAYYLGSAGNNDSFSVRTDTSRIPTAVLRSNALQEAGFSGPAMVGATPTTVCAAWGGGSAVGAFNGGAPVIDGAAASPLTNPTHNRLNDDRTGANGTNIILRFLRVWSGKKLSAGDTQRESARVR